MTHTCRKCGETKAKDEMRLYSNNKPSKTCLKCSGGG